MSVNNAMTADFLRSAYGGENAAHMRYGTWGELAEKGGMKNIGRLFIAISYAEKVHATNHFNVLDTQKGPYTVTSGAEFGIGSLVENLQGAINGELHEIEQMYPVYYNAAVFQDEKGAQQSFHFALEAEKNHAMLFKEAQDTAKEGKDMNFSAVYICPICGHTVLDHAPDKCPICGAKKELFKAF